MDVDSNAADLSVWDPSSAWNPPQTEKVEPDHARLELVEAMRGLLNTGDFADMTIICQHRFWKVHKSILCPRSQFFFACCKNGFKEAKFGQIVLPDDDPVMIENLLEYLYTLDYPCNQEISAEALGIAVDKHARMYITGDKYGVKALKSTAALKFKAAFMNAVDHAFWDGRDPQQDLWETMITVVRLLYQNTSEADGVMREIVATTIWDRIAAIRTIRNFDKMLLHNPELGVTLFKKAIRIADPPDNRARKW